MERVGRRLIAANPIDFVPVSVEEEEEGSSGDRVLPEDRFAGRVAAERPVENEFFGQELAVLGIFVVLLTQQ
jgi:hypothetical protein